MGKYIEKIRRYCKGVKPLVVIKCFTYNQEAYIRDSLEGFVKQKTNFPFIAIVHDDASTDRTAAIVSEYANRYPSIIFPILETNNQYSKHDGSLTNIINQACYVTGAKYIALCEGDDYWIDPLKLQKQVDFLEKNPEYTASTTNFISFDSNKGKVYAIGGIQYKSLYDMLWRDVQFGTATMLIRHDILKDYYEEIKPDEKNWLMGDKPLMFYLGYRGKVKNIPDCTSVYRILSESASHSANVDLQLKRARNTIDIYKYFADKYLGKNSQLIKKIEGGFLYRAYCIYRKSNIPLPENLKKQILKYSGAYWKVHISKLFIIFPFSKKLAYLLGDIKRNLKNKIHLTKINDDGEKTL